jgi:hypothetical protein
MLVKLSKQDVHSSELMGADTVKLCEMQGFKPRLDNNKQSRVEANIYGFKAEFAVARLLGLDPPVINVVTDGGVDLWFNDISIDVKFNNAEFGKLIFDSMGKFKSQLAVLVGRTEEPNVMRINGWMGRTNFEKTSHSKNFGYGDRLFIDHKDLLPVELLWKCLMEYKFKG